VFSGDGKRVAVTSPAAAFVADVATGRVLSTIIPLAGCPIALSHDGKRLAFAKNGAIGFWGVEHNRKVAVGDQSVMWGWPAMLFAADGSLFIDTTMGLARLSPEGKVVQRWRMPARIVHLALSHNDRYLWCGNANGTTYVLDLKRR
jgi:hypothetical protein